MFCDSAFSFKKHLWANAVTVNEGDSVVNLGPDYIDTDA
jgi:hypothetical protein